MAKQDTYEFEYEGIVVDIKVRKEILRLAGEIHQAEIRVNNANRNIIFLIEERNSRSEDAAFVEDCRKAEIAAVQIRNFWQNVVDENNDAIAALLAAYGRG